MTPRRGVLPILTLAIRNEADVVLVRQRARIVAELLGFETVDQTRVATAVSEIARNALAHGGGGTARFAAGGSPPALHVAIEDRGPGLRQPPEPPPRPGLDGVRLRGGMGLHLARRLMDTFEIVEPPAGTAILMSKHLPAPAEEVTAEAVRGVVDELMTRPPESLLEELHQQHQELLAVLEDLNRQQESLRAANVELEETNRGVMALYSEVTRELDDTNRGVVALYAQLDDQAAELRRVNALKDRFLSHLSHEFRTPLNSTLALSRLLMDRVDGPLTAEQAVQVGFIRTGAEDLLAMVNDLLDIAKIEAGRMDVRPEEFSVAELIGGLRGVFRPLAAEAGLELDLAEPQPGLPPMRTDRSKLGQVLRNLLANAIQYTDRGTVRLDVTEDDGHLTFAVRDTGIGIAPEDMERIFQDYVRTDSARRPPTRGTGLGLPIARELARLLGGEITAESELGRGSIFRVRLPLSMGAGTGEQPEAEPAEEPAELGGGSPRVPESVPTPPAVPVGQAAARASGEGQPVVLVIDDDAASRYMVEHTLAPAGCRVVHAETGAEGLAAALADPPAAIFLDLGLPDASGFDLLQRLNQARQVAHCPIIIYTCRELDHEQSRSLSGFALRIIHKSDPALLNSIASIGDALVGMTTRTDEEGDS
jgi:signal transduction histidine kinase